MMVTGRILEQLRPSTMPIWGLPRSPSLTSGDLLEFLWHEGMNYNEKIISDSLATANRAKSSLFAETRKEMLIKLSFNLVR